MMSAITLLIALASNSALEAPHQLAIIDGSELVGNHLDIDFGASRNRLSLLPNNRAIISNGNGIVSYARWAASPGKLCLQLDSGAEECWPYEAAFIPDKTVSLKSDCGAPSSWTLRIPTH